MANNNRNRRTGHRSLATILGHDLLNLALILAFLNVDPTPDPSNLSSRKVVDDLSALGRYNGHFNHDQPVEISAYILTDFNNTINVTQSAVNDSTTQSHQQIISAAYEDSGVSDVDSGHQSGEDEDNLSSATARYSTSSITSTSSPAHLEDLDDLPDFDFLIDDIKREKFDEAVDEEEEETPSTGYEGLFESDESSAIFRDLDDLIGAGQNEDVKMEEEEEEDTFAPDAEDVENQLMHIDDQLIRLDENIEDIADHLDVQLLNSAHGGGGRNVEETEALLTQEEENFLFESMPEVMDPLHGWQFDNEANAEEIDELIAAGLPSPLLPSPFYQQQHQESDSDVEKPKTSSVKQETEQQQQMDNDSYDEMMFDWSQPASPSDSLASTFLSSHDLEPAEDETASHLLDDHNYAMSAFDECFGGAAAENEKSMYPQLPDFDFVGGASALSPAPSMLSTTTQRENRDERKARELGLPFTLDEVIDLPIDGFNDLLAAHTLNEPQLSLCRDIRRRGKNKVAAQNCRKRKMDLISQLEGDVSRARHQKQVLIAEREELFRLRNQWSDKLMHLEHAVLRGLNKNVEDFTLDLKGPGVRVAPRLAKPTKA